MSRFFVRPLLSFQSLLSFPGDKSIAQRSIILASLSEGVTTIKNFPLNEDCLSTLNAFKALGVRVKILKKNRILSTAKIQVEGVGLYGLRASRRALSLGDSGTTFRLLSGVLAGQDFESKLIAGRSLSQRPMLRVNAPLRLMGAKIKSRVRIKNSKVEEFPPTIIKAGNLKSITYKMTVASAQVKSAILLAALYAFGKTKVIEPVKTRDHTERMLKAFKADIKKIGNEILLNGGKQLKSPGEITIPADISSAAFFIALTLISKNSKLSIKRLNLNPSRLGLIRVLKRMGAQIRIIKSKNKDNYAGESVAGLIVVSGPLKGTRVKKGEVPALIDELPILMVIACFASSTTIIEGVGELRVKETDRINSMSRNLIKMGAKISIGKYGNQENIIIKGVKVLHAARVSSFGDHRTAMSMIIAGLRAEGRTVVDDISCIKKSFPNFLALLAILKPSKSHPST